MMERREFIQACTVVLGSAVIPIGCGQSGGGSDLATDDFSRPDLSRARWLDIADPTFSVSHSTYGVIDMTLVSIDDEVYDPVTDQFSIVLTGPDAPLFDDDVYKVYNSSLGYIDLYLQQSESLPGEQRYRTMFSILLS